MTSILIYVVKVSPEHTESFSYRALFVKLLTKKIHK